MMLCDATGTAMEVLHLEELVKTTEIKEFFSQFNTKESVNWKGKFHTQ